MSDGRINPVLRRLACDPRDRVVVIHADDIGMCGATVDAFMELAEAGRVSSGAVMVPCPWFPTVAARCRGRADLDVGVHLSLTSEWDGYRWAPMSTRDRSSGLIDEEGYFYRNQDAWSVIDPVAARVEMDTQVDRALAAGIDVTHVDSHMFAVLHGPLPNEYVELAQARRIPPLLTREAGWVRALSEPRIATWEAQGFPVFDDVVAMPLNEPASDWLERAKHVFDELAPGLTYLIIHPAMDTPELRAIADDWRQRVADFETFRSDALTRHIRASGVQVVGWRVIRELMRAERSSNG